MSYEFSVHSKSIQKRSCRLRGGSFSVVMAIVAVWNTALDPWLCVPVFRRVCRYRYDLLLVRFNWKNKNGPADKSQVRKWKRNIVISFRRSGDHGCVKHNFRPVALRPCFSTGLPLSFSTYSLAQLHIFWLFICLTAPCIFVIFESAEYLKKTHVFPLETMLHLIYSGWRNNFPFG